MSFCEDEKQKKPGKLSKTVHYVMLGTGDLFYNSFNGKFQKKVRQTIHF